MVAWDSSLRAYLLRFLFACLFPGLSFPAVDFFGDRFVAVCAALFNSASDASMHSTKKRMSGMISRVEITLKDIFPS